MANIVVTDGEQRSALAIVRSLGRVGHRCVVVSRGKSLAGASRHAAREVVLPAPDESPAVFARAVASLALEEDSRLVIPVTEEAILAILAHRDEIGATVPFPDLERFRSVCDKKHVLQVAKSIGIRVPKQYEIRSRDEEPPASELPIVLKPTRSVFSEADGSQHKTGVTWIRRPGEMQRALRAYPDNAFPILAQEVVNGPGIGIFLFVRDGKVLARFAHQRILEKPPSGGVSVLSRSEPMDETLQTLSLRLLDELGWTGVAMVEYKRDSMTGEPVLMEINGRFWGSLQLAIDAGVDFPKLVVEAALGGDFDPVTKYRNTRLRWEWGHVDHVIARLKDNDTSHGNRMRALVEWVAAFPPAARSEIFRVSDPVPYFRESVDWFRHVFR